MAETVDHVVAQFKYSYEYEGKMVSFKKGEVFQLLNTSNNDWWQVRRWLENGTCENLYVPANYMKIKKEESSHLYANMADLQEELRKARQQIPQQEKKVPQEKKIPPQTQPKTSPKLVRTKSIDANKQPSANGHPATSTSLNNKTNPEPEYAVPHSPLHSRKKVTPATTTATTTEDPPPPPLPAPRETTAPVPKKRSQSLATELEDDSAGHRGLPVSTQARKSIPTLLENDSHRQHLESSLHKQLESALTKQLNQTLGGGGGGGAGPPPPVATGGDKLVPAPKPKPRALSRPKSYCIDDETPAEISTFKTTNTFGIPEDRPIGEAPPTRRSYKRQDYDVQSSSESNKTDSTNHIPHSGGPKQFQIPNPLSVPSPTAQVVIATSSPTPSPVSPLPDGWTEHKTPEGRTYYYNVNTKESKWTPPTLATPPVTTPTPQSSNQDNSPLGKVAPRGWTKEISLLTQTPVYTNCRTGEKWALAQDDRGYYYYNTANKNLTMRDLPAVDIPPLNSGPPLRAESDSIYDHLNPATEVKQRSRALSEDEGVGLEGGGALLREHPRLEVRSSHPVGMTASPEVDLWSSMMTSHKKLGYLNKKRLNEPGGKKVRSDKWVKQFTVLQGNQLLFYNDHKTRDNPGVKPTVFLLLRANISNATVKDKKKHVILVTSALTSEQFYLQADSAAMCNDWYTALQSAIDNTNEDFKKNPDKYEVFGASLDNSESSSPQLQSKFGHNRKISLPRGMSAADDDDMMEEIEGLSGAEKTVRIKGRLRNLIARRPQVEQLKKSGIIQESVFGCELAHLTEREQGTVPKFMIHFMDHIEKKGLDTVGLYRLSGNAAQVQKLRYLVEQDPYVNLNTSEWNDVNIITGCLKLYLRELPDPLIPFKQFRSFIDAARVQPQDKRLLTIRSELSRLPDPNYHTLKALIVHLQKVVEKGHINKMMATNVSIVFGPTVMRAEFDSIEMATLMPVQNSLVELFLTEFDKLFSK